jgi:hypothetical protein
VAGGQRAWSAKQEGSNEAKPVGARMSAVRNAA